MWLWIASDAKTKIIPVIQVGQETLNDFVYTQVIKHQRRRKTVENGNPDNIASPPLTY
jgi:hypothetical protein